MRSISPFHANILFSHRHIVRRRHCTHQYHLLHLACQAYESTKCRRTFMLKSGSCRVGWPFRSGCVCFRRSRSRALFSSGVGFCWSLNSCSTVMKSRRRRGARESSFMWSDGSGPCFASCPHITVVPVLSTRVSCATQGNFNTPLGVQLGSFASMKTGNVRRTSMTYHAKHFPSGVKRIPFCVV